MVDRVFGFEFFVFPREIGRFEVSAVFADLVDDLMDVVFVRPAEFGAHIAIEYDSFRGAVIQVGEEFGLVLFRAVIGGFEIGTGDVFAMIHGHHLFGGVGEEIFHDRDIASDKFESDSGFVSADNGENGRVFVGLGADLRFSRGEDPFSLERGFHPVEDIPCRRFGIKRV